MILPALALAAASFAVDASMNDGTVGWAAILSRTCATAYTAQGSTVSCTATAEAPARGGVRGVSPEALIEVAREVSPEWGTSLAEARARDPEAFKAAMSKGFRRLSSLAVLKARKPALYALRVEEIRVQGEIDALGPMWASASLTARAEEAASLEARIRGLSGTLVDLNLRSRAMELAELDAVMRSMRLELERDSRARESSVDAVVAACKAGSPSSVNLGRAPVDTLPPAAQTQPDAAASGRGVAPASPDGTTPREAPAADSPNP